MLDTLQTILEFLNGICYGAYTIADTIKQGVDFVVYGVPYMSNFFHSLHLHPFFSAPMFACLGLGVLRFFWIGGGD